MAWSKAGLLGGWGPVDGWEGGEVDNALATRCAVGEGLPPKSIGSGSTESDPFHLVNQGMGDSSGAPTLPSLETSGLLVPPFKSSTVVPDVDASKLGGGGSGSPGSVSVNASRGDDTLRTRSTARSHFERDV